MDTFIVVLIALFILITALIATVMVIKFCPHNLSSIQTKTIIHPKRRTISVTEASQQFPAKAIKSVNKSCVNEPPRKSKHELSDIENFRKTSLPGYISVKTTSKENDVDLLTKAPVALPPTSVLRCASEMSLARAMMTVPVEEQRLSTTQLNEFKLMDVGALPRDIASELEEKEKLEKDKQKWFL
ncbi:hypothetical protein Tcan_12932 [Toxocara canis]|uniref:Uncharacterized protein n=1 Tax=Toxocara canis TaxID=6265 RepID=A0A0B2VN05_TOXCA|nr:hypothetical protein Tcan_12932 [Toxocara canis]